MTEQINSPTPNDPGPERTGLARLLSPLRKRGVLIAIIAVIVLLVAGSVTAALAIKAREDAEETARQCSVAVDTATATQAQLEESILNAEASLETVASIDLPDTEGWQSTAYAERAGTDEVVAVEASEGVEAVEAVPARPSAAELIATVTDGRDALAEIELATECTEREEAAEITTHADHASDQVAALDEDVTVLLADFTTFQEEEKVRIAAEIEAARIAAEKAAAEEAARIAAEEEDARIAAERERWNNSNYGGGGGGGNSGGGGGNSGGGGGGGGNPPAPANPGGGMIGDGSGGCRTDNGMGGTRPC